MTGGFGMSRDMFQNPKKSQIVWDSYQINNTHMFKRKSVLVKHMFFLNKDVCEQEYTCGRKYYIYISRYV